MHTTVSTNGETEADTPAHLTTKASVLDGAKNLKLVSRSLPPPAADEVQVAVLATGLCGSDLHYYHHNRNGDIKVVEPLTLGHESAGEIVAVGAAVDSLQIGDRVALEVGLPCGTCARCTEGRYNICRDMRFRSSAKSVPHFQGTLQERINHPAAWCHKLPDSLSLELGAVLEPLAVALHAARRCGLAPNSSVLVLGAGAVGMLAAAVAKLQGAKNVLIADIEQSRVDFAVAKRFAHAGFLVPVRRGQDIEENLAIAKETAVAISSAETRGGSGSGSSSVFGEADAVFECTGVPSCVQTAIYATRPGGRVMLVGMGHPVQTLPIAAAALREVDLVGVFRYAHAYSEGITLLSSTAAQDQDSPDFSSLISHRFVGLDSVESAFQMAGRMKDDDGRLVLKVLVQSNKASQ